MFRVGINFTKKTKDFLSQQIELFQKTAKKLQILVDSTTKFLAQFSQDDNKF